MAQEQPQLRTDWRPPTETVFFDCSRAIYLPPRLPDGTTATNVIRRVYLDGKALVRFELAVFGNAKHHYPDSKGRLDEFARFFWKSDVEVAEDKPERLATALPKLVQNFAEATSSPGTPPPLNRACTILEPQILVIAEGRRGELEAIARRVDTEGMIWVAVRSLKMVGWANKIDTVYVLHVPEYLNDQFRTRFDYLRLIERQTAWLHADLLALVHIVRSCLLGKVGADIVSEYILELAKGLLSVPELDGPARFLLAGLMRVLKEFHGNRISLLVSRMKASALSDEVKDTLGTFLQLPASLRFVGDVSSVRKPTENSALLTDGIPEYFSCYPDPS